MLSLPPSLPPFLSQQVLSVFENLHQGQILCGEVGQDGMLFTGGESTVSGTCEHMKCSMYIHVYYQWWIQKGFRSFRETPFCLNNCCSLNNCGNDGLPGH